VSDLKLSPAQAWARLESGNRHWAAGHLVLWDFQSRSVMLQVLTVSLLNIGSWVV